MASAVSQTCQNCRQNFAIKKEDFDFYAKSKVPAPTFCPDCRIQRKMLFRNDLLLYKRQCSKCQKDIISIYSDDKPYQVYCKECWSSDKWSPMDFGHEYDFKKPFFAQLQELSLKIPRQFLYQEDNVNSPWVNRISKSQNCYMDIGGEGNQDTAYNYGIAGSKDCYDNYILLKGELSYDNFFCTSVYKTFFSKFCIACTETYFSANCNNCSYLIGCVNLKNKQYHIFNKPVTPLQFEEQVRHLASRQYLGNMWRDLKAFQLANIHRYAAIRQCEDSVGDYLVNCKNCYDCFDLIDSENCRYQYFTAFNRDCMDVFAGVRLENCYEFMEGDSFYSAFFSRDGTNSHDVQYCHEMKNCHNCFGCFMLKDKSYCIFNKQYSKEDYFKLRDKIIAQMDYLPYHDPTGPIYKYGEFFPPMMSPFGYNETHAGEYFPLTQEEAEVKGYKWHEPKSRDGVKPTIFSHDIADDIQQIRDNIVNQVIACEHEGKCQENCTIVYKIIPGELEFCRKMKIPLPRMCLNCRHARRMKQRQPLKLWSRQCHCLGTKSGQGNYSNIASHSHDTRPCSNTFLTTYSPDSVEIVYCEPCYQSEMV
ncbi:hypothetical protein HY224_01980 [Candidatus Uhrbacteria bacterium]|nr:hypothetical protein [Candidatus Uhrbacteria bacterium]